MAGEFAGHMEVDQIFTNYYVGDPISIVSHLKNRKQKYRHWKLETQLPVTHLLEINEVEKEANETFWTT